MEAPYPYTGTLSFYVLDIYGSGQQRNTSRDTKLIVEYSATLTGGYSIFIEIFSLGYLETEIYDIPYAVAWIVE